MKLSILTPTYNRACLLERAFASLCKQSCLDFEWVVVDDGSVDNSETLIQKFIEKETNFKIKYFKQENGGKHRALNNGIKHVEGDYVLILDSDDYLTSDAVETTYKWIEEIKDLPNMAGIAGLRGWADREDAIGGFIKEDFIDCTNIERKKFGLSGDKVEVYKTSILKEFSFPEFENEKFLSEACVWDLIAKHGYKIRWYNKIIYKCDYLEGGLTKSLNEDVLLKNFQGYTCYVKVYVSTHHGLTKLNLIGCYNKIARKKGLHPKEIASNLSIGLFTLFMGRIIHKLNTVVKKIKGGRSESRR